MRVPMRLAETLAAVALAASGSACHVVFSSPPPERTPAVDAPATVLLARVEEKNETYYDGRIRAPIAVQTPRALDAVRGLEDCACIAGILSEPDSHDVVLEIEIENTANVPVSIVWFPLPVLPQPQERTLQIRVTAHDPRTGARAVTERHARYRAWASLLFTGPIWLLWDNARFEGRLYAQLAREAVAEAIVRLREANRQGGAAGGTGAAPGAGDPPGGPASARAAPTAEAERPADAPAEEAERPDAPRP